MKIMTKIWIGFAALVALTPLGLILPRYFKAGTGWGEWGSEELRQSAGYVPKGLEKLSGLWKAPFPGYGFKSWDQKDLTHDSFAYLVSAVVGAALIVFLVIVIGRSLVKKR